MNEPDAANRAHMSYWVTARLLPASALRLTKPSDFAGLPVDLGEGDVVGTCCNPRIEGDWLVCEIEMNEDQAAREAQWALDRGLTVSLEWPGGEYRLRADAP